MTQYLITTFIDSTGIPHNHITEARENQSFKVVEAESEEEAKEIYKKITGLSECPNCKKLGRNLIGKDYDTPIEYMKCKTCGHNYHRLGGKFDV